MQSCICVIVVVGLKLTHFPIVSGISDNDGYDDDHYDNLVCGSDLEEWLDEYYKQMRDSPSFILLCFERLMWLLILF